MKHLFLLGLIALTSLASCKKEGCTNPDAKNFDESAKKDNSTCEFEGGHVFWFDEESSDNLVDYDSQSLQFYVDGELVGSTGTNVFWTSAPECGEASSITVVRDLGSNTTQSYSYRVLDNYDEVIWEGVANFNANTCTSIELVF